MTRHLLIASALMLASSAYADPKSDAKDHIAKATAAHKAQKYDDALKELTLAYALDPQPELLFAIGQVHMKIGDCASATTFYERFIASKPNPKEAAIAQKAITTCKDHPPEPKHDEKPVEPPKPIEPPKPVEPELKAEPPPPPPPPLEGRPWTRDFVGHALVGVGLICGAVAVVEWRGAGSARDDADRATTYGAYRDLLDDAHGKQNLALGFAIGAGALVGAGVIHYLVTGKPEHTPLAVVPVKGGSMATWTAHF